MEANYLILSDYSTGGLIKIKFTDEEKRIMETYEDMEAFIREQLEVKYDFKLDCCCWMTTENLCERTYNL